MEGGAATRMTPDWKQWEGRQVDGRFTLERCLHSGPNGAVYLTEQGGGPAAIRLVQTDAKSAESLLKRWNQAAKLSQPNLAKLREVGSFKSEGVEGIFAVTDFGEEILADVLKERALDAAEARQVLEPILGVLAYLHSNGYAHGRLNPSNLMAVGDQLKLSIESVRRIGEPGSDASTAGDVYGLGLTLVQALTQRQPDFQDGRYDEPLLPEMPAPFLEIARGCLHRDPLKRWSVEQIGARLREPHRSGRPAKPPGGARFRLASVPLLVVGLFVMALAGAIVYSKWLKPGEAAATAPIVTEKKAPEKTAEAPPPVPEKPLTRAEKRAKERAEKAEKRAREREEKKAAALAKAPATPPVSTTTPPPSAAAPVATAPAKPANDRSDRSDKKAGDKTAGDKATEEPDTSAGLPAIGVIRQVVPEVTPKARATITGKVKTSIKVQVDSAGNVSGAQIDSQGSSLYFAGLALGAARKWQFAPAEGDSAREWILSFEFTRERTRINAARK